MSTPTLDRAAVPMPVPDGDGVLTADGTHHDDLRDALSHLMRLCGCGYIGAIQADAVEALRYAATPHDDRPPLPDLDVAVRYHELLLHLLDDLGLVEHGGTVTAGWATPLGVDWLAALDAETRAAAPEGAAP